jgi:hypothetical protein
MIGIPLPVKKGVRLAAIWESDDFYRGRPSSREALRRLALWGYVGAVAQCAGRRNRTKSLATKQVLSADSFCVNAINAHNESNDVGHISGGWMTAEIQGEKCMRTYSGVPITAYTP